MHNSPFQAFAIVPAAGRSARMGRPKLLLPWREGSVIESQLQAWRASRVAAVVVVVHPDDGKLAEVCRRAGAEVVVPDAAPPTMKASVLHGLEYIGGRYAPSASDAWLLAPADMPMLGSELINRILAAYDPNQPRIIMPECQGERGHPVLFPWWLVEEVRGLSPEEGLNVLRRRHGAEQILVADRGALVDIDTPGDYQRLHEAGGGVTLCNSAETPRPT